MHSLRRVFAAVAVVVVLAPLVASAPLFDPDEGLHAAIAQEMVRTGDYVTPKFLGEPFLDKPILFFWAEAASLQLFGDTEAAVRLPPLLFGLAGMLSVALLARALFGAATGLTSGIVYATMLVPFALSQVAVHDIGVVPFMCIAAWCLVRLAAADASPRLPRVVLFGVVAGICLGLSILTKGLVAIVFAGVLCACLVVWRRPAFARLLVALGVAVVVAAIVAAPWYVAMEHAHPGYLHYYFVERHVQGYLTATQRHAGRPFWYYVPIVLGGALPWALHLAGAARSAGKRPRRLVVWGWFAAGLVFLSAGESKLATYALPLFPAIAILIGDHLVEARPRAAIAMQVVFLAGLPAAALVAYQVRFEPVPAAAWLPIVVLGILTVDAGRRALKSADGIAGVRWLAQACLCSLIATMTLAPRLASWMTAKDLAAVLNAAGTLPPRVLVLDERIGSLVFYLDPALRAEATRDRLTEASFAEAMAGVRHDPDETVLAVRNDYLSRFNRLFRTAPIPGARAGTFSVFRIADLRDTLQPRKP